jgi:hypothetical protein
VCAADTTCEHDQKDGYDHEPDYLPKLEHAVSPPDQRCRLTHRVRLRAGALAALASPCSM